MCLQILAVDLGPVARERIIVLGRLAQVSPTVLEDEGGAGGGIVALDYLDALG